MAVGVAAKCLEGLLNIFLRGILGTIAIFLINGGLAALGITLSVGINLVLIFKLEYILYVSN